MLGISWMNRVSNEPVLKRMNQRRKVMNAIQRRRLEYLGHIRQNEKSTSSLRKFSMERSMAREDPESVRCIMFEKLKNMIFQNNH